MNDDSPAERRTRWRTMLLLRENIRWYKSNNGQGNYDDAILSYTTIYRDYLKEFLTRET